MVQEKCRIDCHGEVKILNLAGKWVLKIEEMGKNNVDE